MKYLRQTYTETFKFNWVPCIFILLNLAALSREPSGLLAYPSTWKWRLSSDPPILMVQLLSLCRRPQTPILSPPSAGQGQGRQLCPAPRQFCLDGFSCVGGHMLSSITHELCCCVVGRRALEIIKLLLVPSPGGVRAGELGN